MPVAVQTDTEGANTTAVTDHTVAFPSGATTGDLVIIWFTTGVAVTLTSISDGFTTLASSPAGSLTQWIFYKQIDGTEGGDALITVGATTRAAWTVYRISGHADPSVQAPEVSTVATASSVNPDASSISPTGGSKEYLFITGFRTAGEEDDDDTWVSVTPTNYANLLMKTSGLVGANSSHATARRTTTTATEDAGAFTVDTTGTWHAFTVAVHPSGEVSTPLRVLTSPNRW